MRLDRQTPNGPSERANAYALRSNSWDLASDRGRHRDDHLQHARTLPACPPLATIGMLTLIQAAGMLGDDDNDGECQTSTTAPLFGRAAGQVTNGGRRAREYRSSAQARALEP
ncbi:hypothetical protein AURDEDRAFT_115938 [Auricularia subglabra TFB-10046 SS5]|nr:hypothetical protein AURDEDRAFT_115938 [Auricularia subglabra TFB-10046 SS5]